MKGNQGETSTREKVKAVRRINPERDDSAAAMIPSVRASLAQG